MNPLRFGVLASGAGSNLQAILNRIDAGELNAKLVFTVSNNSQALVLEKTRKEGAIPYHVSLKTEGSEAGVSSKLVSIIEENAVDLLILAGYMKKVPLAVLNLLPNRILNIHPALLPAFGGEGYYGKRVHEGVVQRGCQFTGVTLHMVNQDYDAGQIVLQRIVAVLPGMDAEAVGKEVLQLEHDSFWRVLKAFSEEEIVPTDSKNAAEAVRIHPDWILRMRELDQKS